MIKITDKYKLDAEEIKRELISQMCDCRMQFDQALTLTGITEEQRLAMLNMVANSCAAFSTFLARTCGIEVRNEDGGMVGTAYQGYFMAKIQDIKQRIKSEKA